MKPTPEQIDAGVAALHREDLTLPSKEFVENILTAALSASPAGVVKPTPLSDKLRYEADGMFAAIQGEDYGDTLHLYNWHDKPHRVVYDAVDLLRQAADEIDSLSARIMSAIEPAGVGVETVVRERDDKAACLREIIRHAKAEGNRYCEDEFGAPYIVNDRAEAAEATLQTAIYRLCVIQDSPNLTDGEKALLTSWVNDLRAALKGDEQ